MGAVPWGVIVASIPLQFDGTLALISLQKEPQSCHDRATIARRSWCRCSNVHRPMIVEVIPRRKLHDRGSIAPRSRFDRTAIVEFFHESSKPSDRNREERPLPAIRSMKIAIKP